jgi:hypothetical protein
LLCQRWLDNGHERPAIDVFENRALEINGYLPISVEGLVDALKRPGAHRA